MDMQINKERLRQEREKRSWTQSHLAEIADLSLRTVQRIEANGIASKESAMALASALDITLPDLLIKPLPVSSASIADRRWLGIAGIISLLLVTLGWWSTASAEQVTINLSIKSATGDASNMQLLNEVGKQSEVTFDQQFRLLLTTKRQHDHLEIATEVYDFVDGKYQLISTPAIWVMDNEESAIHLDIPSSGKLELGFIVDY